MGFMMDILKQYVDEFNKNDEESYINDIPNSKAYEWMKENIPLICCPDKVIEKAYYFRWWTYRKHIKTTPDGCIITEFLPKVKWSQKYNSINAAAGHHISEGKWLKNSSEYLDSYIDFFLEEKGNPYQYSSWLLHSVMEYYELTGNLPKDDELLDKCIRYYEKWESEHSTPVGLFWSYDNFDAMEFTISGTRDGKCVKGLRPTLNSYMYAEALSVSKLAKLMGKDDIAKEYAGKARKIKELINKYLKKDGFYYALHPENENFTPEALSKCNLVKEVIGYIPWWFDIADENDISAFDMLLDEKVFYTPNGMANADQSHPDFLGEYNHECLWNGYVWPFTISQTLNALRKITKNKNCPQKYKDMYLKLLHQYAELHHRTKSNGKTVMWIDECRHPQKDLWSSREILKNLGWLECKGGYERGKDYNHSTFCDLVLSYFIDIDISSSEPKIKLNIPDEWEYFSVSNLHIKNRSFNIDYNKNDESPVIKIIA